jgi:hypothetical protein
MAGSRRTLAMSSPWGCDCCFPPSGIIGPDEPDSSAPASAPGLALAGGGVICDWRLGGWHRREEGA